MTQNENLQDGDFRLLSSICERFEQGITAGQSASIETVLDDAPAGLRNALLAGLLPIELKHLQSSGVPSRVEDYLARFPDQEEAVLRVFGEANTLSKLDGRSDRTPASTHEDVNTRTMIVGNEELAAADTVLNDSSVEAESSEPTLDAIFPIYPDGKGYIVEQEIDRGGMGVVLKVRDEHLQRTLALKVIRGQERAGGSSRVHSDQGMLARFVREAQVTGQLDHPGVVPIHELATDKEGRMYFTMKYVQGKTLSKVIPELRKKSSQWSLTRVLEVLIRVCETLAFAHSKKVIHRDLKPANIMVGEFGEAYVMDWGLAKILGEADEPVSPSAAPRSADGLKSQSHSGSGSRSQSQTMYGDVVGTAYYMPPEQAAGRIDELDARTDVYSVGAVLYEILTGQSPYRAGKRLGHEIVRDVLHGPPQPIRELCRTAPPELVAIAEKAMSRRMEDRYGSIAEMADDLRAYLSQRVVIAYQSGVIARLKKWVVRNQSITIAGLLTLATIAGALGVVALLQFKNQTEITNKNRELNTTLAEKDKAMNDSRVAAEREKNARDEVNGLSLMSHSKNVLTQGDATLASLLALESVARIPNSATRETLYSAVAELVDAADLDPNSNCNDLAWSQDERHLLAVCDDGTGTIWDVETTNAIAMIVNSPEGPISTALFSGDGRQILTAGSWGTVAVWDTATGIRQLALAVGNSEGSASGNSASRPDIIAAAFCADIETGESEARIVAASKAGLLHVFDRRTGRELAILKPASETVGSPFTRFAVSPDGRDFVVGCEDGHVYVWKDQRHFLKAINAQTQPIRNITFSPDGELFTTCASAGKDQDQGQDIASPAFCWQTDTGALHCEIAPGGLHVCSAEFHPTGSLIALGLSDRTLCLWDLEKQKIIAMSTPQDGVIEQLSFSNSGDRIASVAADNELMMWVVMAQSDTFSLSDSRRLFGHRRKIDRVVYNRSGSRIASAAGAEIRVWNTDTRNAIPTFGSPSFTSLVHFTHHGDRIFGVDLARKRTSLWSYPDINLISESGFSADAYANHFTADGLHIAMSFLDGQCRLWDSRTGELQFEYQCPEPAVFLTCSGSRLCIGNDAEATVWDWKSKELRGTIRNPQFGKFRASPDGRVLLAQHQDSAEGTMARFELDGDLSMPQEIEKSETCNPGYFSKSGRYFWCHGIQQPGYAIPISSYIRIIDTQSGAVILNTHEGDSLVRNVFIDDTDTRLFIDYVQHPRHTAEIYSLPDGALIDSIGPPEGEVTAWTNDMSFVAFRSVDGSTLLWNSAGDKLVGKLEIGGSQCRSVCFSEDNKYVAVEHFSESTGADAGTNRVSLWSTQPLNLITIVPGKNKCAFQTAFLRDGENFWTLSAENQIRVWPLDVVACAKKHVSRTLTVDEQRMYGVDRIRQVPDAAPRQRPERTLKWNHLSDRIRLLSPVTAERRRSAVALIADVKRWLHEKATQEEVSQALETVELLRSGPFDTDPLVLAGIAELHAEFGDPHTAVQLLELAARHPRAVDLDGALAEARNKIAPRLVSLRSADAVAEAAFAETATSDDNRAYENARTWVAEHSPPMAHYLAARRLRLEGKVELAQPILRQLADTALTSSGPETGPEVFLQLAECHMELGQPEAAVSVLRSALEEERLCPPEIWNRWLQISFANLGLSPQQLMTQLPMKTNSIAPELRYEESVSWLLDQLSRSQPLRINCGGDRYVAADSSVWESDRFFTQGHGYFGTDGDAKLFSEPIANTKDPVLYQSERWFRIDRPDPPPGYQIPVPNGLYEVRLGFAEIYAAERSFDVLLCGKTVLTEYDPGHGAWATADEFVTQAVVNHGRLDIAFTSRNEQNPKISCLQILRIGEVSSAD